MCLGLPAELEAVDRLLDDPVFFEPFRVHFHATLGRPSIPIETYLRLMFLKYRYRLGFEPLCREVADSISWQRFAGSRWACAVPHPTTLMKITTRCGAAAVDGLNDALLAKAVEAKVLKTNQVRADTTVVEANVAYPTDSGLLAKGVARMAKTIRRVKAAGLASRTRTRDRTRTVHARARSIGANLRRRTDAAKDRGARHQRGARRGGRRAVREARAVVRNARRALRRLGDNATGRARAVVDELERTAERVERVAAQTRQRDRRNHARWRDTAGVVARSRCPTDRQGPAGQARRVRLQGPGRRQPRRRRAGPQRRDRQPARRADARARHRPHPHRAGRAPRAVTADRGYGEIAVEHTLEALGVRNVVLPTKGKPSAARRAHEQRRSFQRLVKWRTGSEGRISCLKRDFGWQPHPHRRHRKAPEPGAVTACSTTTSSRSPPSPTDQTASDTQSPRDQPRPRSITPTKSSSVT